MYKTTKCVLFVSKVSVIFMFSSRKWYEAFPKCSLFFFTECFKKKLRLRSKIGSESYLYSVVSMF